jgi:hypothetical protein
MTMTQTDLFPPSDLEDLDLDLGFPLTVGAGFVDPRLVEPICDDPEIEDLIAFRTSTL